MTTAAVLLAALAPAAPVPPDPWAGQKVFPAAPNLALRDAARNDIGRWSVCVGTVLRTDGEWAEVSHMQDPGPYRGWVKKAEVVKLADAPAHFGRLLADDAPWAYMNRAEAWSLSGRSDKAVEDLTALLRVQPAAAVHNARGLARAAAGQYAEAAADYAAVLERDPNAGYAMNNLAWLLATCPDDKVRDGKRAVELATKACEKTGWKLANNVDTLAAAYAEAGDFEQAVKFQKQALDDRTFAATAGTAARERVKLYAAGKPYREAPPAKKD